MSSVVERGRSAILHPLLAVVSTHQCGVARGSVIHEDVPKEVDVGLFAMAFAIADKIAGQ